MSGNNEEVLEEIEEEKKRPKPNAFYQQKLPAWQPVLNAWPVAWLFLALGLFFLGFGIALFIISSSIAQYTIDYTNCVPTNGVAQVTVGSYSSPNYTTCSDFISNPNATSNYLSCQCTVAFTTTSTIAAPTYMYYRLTNYYQNYRRYARSRDDIQLNGQALSLSDVNTDAQCAAPFNGNGSLPYAPCGAVANSMFNDTITLTYSGPNGNMTVPILNTGIAWTSDKTVKFANPASSYWANSLKPPSWPKTADQLSTDQSNTGFINEDFIVWMRTAALPTFRKLYRRVDHTNASFTDGLPAGQYFLNINYAYPVTSFGGTKSIVLTTNSWVGGRSFYIGIVYLAVGSILIILSIIFFIVHVKMTKRTKVGF